MSEINNWFWEWLGKISLIQSILGGGGLIGLIILYAKWKEKRHKKKEPEQIIKLSFKDNKTTSHAIIRPPHRPNWHKERFKGRSLSPDNENHNNKLDRKRLSIPVELCYQKSSYKTAKNIMIILKIHVNPDMFRISHMADDQTKHYYSKREYFKWDRGEDHFRIKIKPAELSGEDLMSNDVQSLRPFYLYYEGCKDFKNPEIIKIECEICAEDFKPHNDTLLIRVEKDSSNIPRDEEGYRFS